jgi:micrococcal nuclease
MKKYFKIRLILTIIIILGLIFSIYIFINYKQKPIIPGNTVTKIIDGDTFELASGEKIRLICIDAPEINKKGYEEAKQFLSDLILNKQVRLENDINNADKYERLLRYVYINNSKSNNNEIFVNKELVKQGYATLFPYENNTKRCDEIDN